MTDLRLGDGCVVDDTVDVPGFRRRGRPTDRTATTPPSGRGRSSTPTSSSATACRRATTSSCANRPSSATTSSWNQDCPRRPLRIGDDASLQTGVYVPPYSDVGDRVFLGPNAVLTNDPIPSGGTATSWARRSATTSASARTRLSLPGVSVESGRSSPPALVVTEDVPPETLAIGVPAEHRPLPPELDATNLQE